MSAPEVADATDPCIVDRAARALREGLVVGIPTDTVYGLAADPFSATAVQAVFGIKHRPAEVALPVLVTSWDQVESLAGDLPVPARRLAERYWPGALTLVVPRRRRFVADLGGPADARHTIGIRWPDHPVVAALCRAVGPLAVTSANRHGAAPLTSAAGVAAAFGLPVAPGPGTAGDVPGLSGPAGDVPGPPGGTGGIGGAGDGVGPVLVLDGGSCDGEPSTVVECLGSDVRCLRSGAIGWEAVRETASDSGGHPT